MAVEEKITAIADNIRAKTGKNDTMTLDEIAENIQDVYDTGSLDAIERHIPKVTISGNPINIPDHLESCNAVNYRVYGNSTQTDTPSPNNPVEVESVGNLVTDGELAGKYKIEIDVIGKNLFDASKAIAPPHDSGAAFNGGITYDADTDEICAMPFAYSSSLGTTATLHEICPTLRVGDVVTLSATVRVDGNVLAPTSIMVHKDAEPGDNPYYDWEFGTSLTITQSMLDNFIGLDCSMTDGEYIYYKIQIEYGTEPTSYEPYEVDKIIIYLNEPLRKIGDYADYIDWKEQKVVRNIKKLLLTSNSNIKEWFPYHDGVRYGFYVAGLPAKSGWNVALSNYFKPTPGGAACTDYSNGLSTLSSSVFIGTDDWATVDEFKVWLDTADAKIYYMSATPTETSLSLEPLPLREGSNDIWAVVNIRPGDIRVEYYQNPSIALKNLNNAIVELGGEIND